MQGNLELAHGQHGPHHGRSTAHISAHAIHLLRRLERDATRVECDPLANEDHSIKFLPPWVVLHDDERCRFLAALGHTQEGAHPQLVRVLLIQDLAAHGVELAGNFQGQLGQVRGSGIVRRPVDQITGQACCFGHDLAQLCPLFRHRHLRLVELYQREPLRIGPIRRLALQFLVAV